MCTSSVQKGIPVWTHKGCVFVTFILGHAHWRHNPLSRYQVYSANVENDCDVIEPKQCCHLKIAKPRHKHLQNRGTRVSSSPIFGQPIEITLTGIGLANRGATFLPAAAGSKVAQFCGLAAVLATLYEPKVPKDKCCKHAQTLGRQIRLFFSFQAGW